MSDDKADQVQSELSARGPKRDVENTQKFNRLNCILPDDLDNNDIAENYENVDNYDTVGNVGNVDNDINVDN